MCVFLFMLATVPVSGSSPKMMNSSSKAAFQPLFLDILRQGRDSDIPAAIIRKTAIISTIFITITNVVCDTTSSTRYGDEEYQDGAIGKSDYASASEAGNSIFLCIRD